MANAMTGGDTRKLLALMAAGKLDPNTALPKFARELEAKAAGGWDKYKNTSRYQQNMTRVAIEDRLMAFNKQGGDNAFFRMWKTFADQIPKMTGFTKLAVSLMQSLATTLDIIAKMLVKVSQGFDLFFKLPDFLQKSIGAMALVKVGILAIGKASEVMGARLKAAFWPLTAAFIVLQDLAYGLSGKDSYTRDFLDSVNGVQRNPDGSVGKAPNALDKYSNAVAGLSQGGVMNRLYAGANTIRWALPATLVQGSQYLGDMLGNNGQSNVRLTASATQMLQDQMVKQYAGNAGVMNINIQGTSDNDLAMGDKVATAITDQLGNQWSMIKVNKPLAE